MPNVDIDTFRILLDRLLDLMEALDGFGWTQGKHEAALVEAQGAQWVKGGGGNHLQSLIEYRNRIVRLEGGVKGVVETIRVANPAASQRLKDILSANLFNRTNAIKAAIDQTETTVRSLRQTDPNRFVGVKFFEGGAGTNVGRTVSSLPSEQLKTMAIRSQLRQGVEPTLLPRTQPAAERTISLIRQMPVSAEDVRRNISQMVAGFLAAVRVWMSQMLSQASAAARLAMIGIEEALVGFGSRLTTPVILIGKPWGEPIQS
ncbi:hypothetical protein [Cupriavidus oxalaticus]|uniref:Uncharacterized protein n=1 Tax=Cupriavidus oxalaticus TaxID=96344 RepID=A0A4P7LGX9_9BURK|nr:hypothetical protein [Cupriavidus oxalaticus]QBY55464.1 hypothetical protein E0W60_30980 [Cupriavidus oxalaticus]